ncbi:hypothetical protein GGR58DRAFT_464694 [Xylaria digitata]|nr:hypothetical protein GGR58DRAFT_464694 [Xylaria digitata]
MSPKVDSRASEPARSAWSRDVRPNTSGVTYSRRSYFYEREFSDSIVRPTDNNSLDATLFSLPHESVGYRSKKESHSERKSAQRSANGRFIPRKEFVDPFTRGRVLQSAGDDDDDDDQSSSCSGSYELQGRVPIGLRAQARVTATPADSEPRSAIAGLDVQALAQGIVFAAGVLVRITETYRRIRDIEENNREGENEGADGFLGLDLDPYHLEAGPPRRSRPTSPRQSLPARKTTPRRALHANTSTVLAVTSEGTQGHTGDVGIATPTQTKALLPPPPASKRVCYYLIAAVIFGIAASFGIAVWWAQSQRDVSAGFTIGGYIIAVDALVVAIFSGVHMPGCRCWKA